MSGFCLVFVCIGLSICYFSIQADRAGAESNRPSLSALRSEWDEKQKDPRFKDNFLQYSRYRAEELTRAGLGTAEKVNWRRARVEARRIFYPRQSRVCGRSGSLQPCGMQLARH
jgi:hypothetical protein